MTRMMCGYRPPDQPTASESIPPEDQQRVIHLASGRFGWECAFRRGSGKCGVQFDGDKTVYWVSPPELANVPNERWELRYRTQRRVQEANEAALFLDHGADTIRKRQLRARLLREAG